MKLLIRIIDLLLCTSIFTACCALGLCMSTERFVTGHMPLIFSNLHALIFGGVLLVYNTPRIIRRPYGVERKARPNHRLYLLFFYIGMAIVLVGSYQMPVGVIVLSGFIGAFAFAYFLPLLPFREKKRLRDYGWAKIIVLAGVWTVSTSILPMLYHGKDILDYPIEILVRLVFIFTLCVVFDLRDVQSDRRNNIDTLPQKMGILNSYRLIDLALLVFVFLSVLQYMRYPSPARLAGAFVTAVITKIVVGYLREHPSERAYSALADGVMIVYAVSVMI